MFLGFVKLIKIEFFFASLKLSGDLEVGKALRIEMLLPC